MIKSVDSALESSNLTSPNNWMSIAPTIFDRLDEKTVRELFKRCILNGGQKEHDKFYTHLERIVGTDQTIKLIEQADKA